MRDYLELTKPRITLLILICTAVGYWFGCGASFHWTILAQALLGTALLASGTSALNQWYEVDSDAKMHRTRRRPLPAGRIKPTHGLVFGLLLSAAGFAVLWSGTNPLAAALGLFTLLTYLLVYTPLKQRSPACTIVGAIPGAMPPLIGYAAAGRGIDAGALALFLILFVWQFPHFDAIAWMYRDDYARGGIRMLPVIDPVGESTTRRILACSLLLTPISLAPLCLGMTGGWYAAAAIAGGLGVLYFGARMRRERSVARAHALLLATVFYLPALLGVMVLDRTPSFPFASSNVSITTTSSYRGIVDGQR
jgi:protoheme IX farnesyltransferase